MSNIIFVMADINSFGLIILIKLIIRLKIRVTISPMNIILNTIIIIIKLLEIKKMLSKTW